MLSTRYTITREERTAKLDYLLDGAELTAFKFDRGQVTATARAETRLSLTDFKQGLQELDLWYQMVGNTFGPARQPISQYAVKLEKTPLEIKLELILNGVVVETAFLMLEREVVSEAREALVLTWSEFEKFLEWLRMLERAIG